MKVRLCPHHQRRRFQARRLPASAVVEPQRQVRALGFASRARDPFLFDRIMGVANARRVDENDGIAAQIEKHLDQIAGRSWDWRGDRDIAAASAFINVDLPTLGGPAITTVKPSRRRWADPRSRAPGRSARLRRAPRFSPIRA